MLLAEILRVNVLFESGVVFLGNRILSSQAAKTFTTIVPLAVFIQDQGGSEKGCRKGIRTET